MLRKIRRHDTQKKVLMYFVWNIFFLPNLKILNVKVNIFLDIIKVTNKSVFLGPQISESGHISLFA